MSELFAKGLKADVVYLSYAGTVPTSEVSHIVVDKEIVRLHIVCPAVQLVISPTIPLTMYYEATYQVLFHRPGIYLAHSVGLHIALEYGTHRLAKFLLVSVSRSTYRLFRLTAIHSKHILHESSDEVVLQWHIAFFLDVVLLGHPLVLEFAFHLYHIAPLVAIGVTLAAFTVKSKLVHIAPKLLSFHQYIKGSAVAKLLSLLDAVHFQLRTDFLH